MSPKLCDQGETNVLSVYLKGDSRDPLYLGIYTDVSEPGEDANLASISELPVANGYDRIALPDANWTVAGNLATHEQQTFTANGGAWGNVTGYFICDAANGNAANLLFVESFSGAFEVVDGANVFVTPAILAS